MESRITVVSATVAAILIVRTLATTAPQNASPQTADEKILREYAGVYQWRANAFLYLQLWSEFSGRNQLVAFDESGEVRTLYPADRDRFSAGPGAAVPTPIESRIEFQRDTDGSVTAMTWRRNGGAIRTARRIEIEQHQDVAFSNGDIHLRGTLIRPLRGNKNPAIVLVHGSGAEDREYLLPFAHFLVRHGIALLGYDKRGTGESTGDWKTASFDDLAGDVVSAIEYLKKRSDIDGTQIGVLGLSQAGWVMPLAAIRTKDLAFLISVSGAGVSAAETTIDEARNEMTSARMRPDAIERVIGLMKLEYEYSRSGQGWAEYAAARDDLISRFGKAPDTFPAARADPYWETIRRLYLYDPAQTLRQLRVPTLAIFGELDDNIMAEKNRAAWETGLRVGGNRDYTLRILPAGDHLQLEAKIGSNAEMPALQRFVPAYFTTVENWRAKRIRGFVPGPK